MSVKRSRCGPVNDLAVDNTEERFLAAAYADSSIRIFNVADPVPHKKHPRGLIKPVATIEKKQGHKFSVTGVCWFPFDTGILTSGSTDQTLVVWDTNVMEQARGFRMNSAVNAHALSPVPDRQHLISVATNENQLRIADIRSGALTTSFSGHTAAVLTTTWSPVDGNILASGGIDSTLRIWDLRSPRTAVATFDPREAPQATKVPHRSDNARRISHNARATAVNGVCFSGDGRVVVSLGHDDEVRVWELNKVGTDIRRPIVDEAARRQPMIVPNSSFSQVRPFIFNDAGVVVVPGDDKVPHLFDLASGQAVGDRLVCHWGRVTSCAARLAVQDVFSGSIDGEILCWTPHFLGRKVSPDRVKMYEDSWNKEIVY